MQVPARSLSRSQVYTTMSSESSFALELLKPMLANVFANNFNNITQWDPVAARNAPRAMVPLSVGPSKRGVEHRGIAQDCSTHTFDVSPPKAFHELLPSRSTCCDPKQKAPSLELSVEQQTPHLAQGDN